MNTDKILYWLFGDRIPVTKSLILTNVATFIYMTLAHTFGPLAHLVFFTSGVTREPWTLVTYPIVNGCEGIFCVLFACYWLWVAGGSIERSWGSRTYAVYFGSSSAVVALALLAGSAITGVRVPLAGLMVPLAAVTVAFAALNPEQEILLFLILPIKLKYVGVISAAALALNFGSVHLLLGVLSLAGCAYSYWYVRSGRYFAASPRAERSENVIRVHERENPLSRLNPFNWIKRHQARRRLRKLFEDSGIDEEDRR